MYKLTTEPRPGITQLLLIVSNSTKMLSFYEAGDVEIKPGYFLFFTPESKPVELL